MPRLAPCKLTFDLLTLKVVSESRVTWPTSVPILVVLDLSVLDLGPMYATDRQTSDVTQTSDAHHRLMPPPYGGGGIIGSCATLAKIHDRKCFSLLHIRDLVHQQVLLIGVLFTS